MRERAARDDWFVFGRAGRFRRPCPHDGRAEVLCQRLRGVSDHLAGIEDVLRVEDPFDFAEHLVERFALSPDKPRAAETESVFATDRAVHFQDLLVQILGQILHSTYMVRVRKVQKRPQVQLPVPNVPKQRGGDGMRLQHVLKLHQESW